MDGLLYYWESKCIYVLYLGVSLQFELTGMWWERKKYKKLVKTVNTYFPWIPACKQTQLNQCNNSWMKTSNIISQLFIWPWINKYVYLCLYSVYSRRRHIQYSKSQVSSQNENYIITQDCLYRLNKIINATLLFLPPFFMSWTFMRLFYVHKRPISLKCCSQICLNCVSEHFSFSEIIHPPHRCGISRCWLDGMIIAQVCLRLATIKGHSKMCSFITQHNPTDVANLREREINMLTAGMSKRCCNLNVNFSTISRLQRRFREFGSTQPASKPQTTCNHISPGPPHPASSPPRSSETSHPDSCCNNRFA